MVVVGGGGGGFGGDDGVAMDERGWKIEGFELGERELKLEERHGSLDKSGRRWWYLGIGYLCSGASRLLL